MGQRRICKKTSPCWGKEAKVFCGPKMQKEFQLEHGQKKPREYAQTSAAEGFFTRPVSATSTIPPCTRTQTIKKCQYQSDNQRCSLLVNLCSQSILLLSFFRLPTPHFPTVHYMDYIYYKLRYTHPEKALSHLRCCSWLNFPTITPRRWGGRRKKEEGGLRPPFPLFYQDLQSAPHPLALPRKRGA